MKPIIKSYETQIDIVDPDSSDAAIDDYTLSKTIGDLLQRTYPMYSWFVRANHRQGVVNIFCGEISSVLSGRIPYGMVLHISKMTDYSIMSKHVIRQAGELLERANLKRGKWSGEFPTHIDGVKPLHQPKG